MGAGTIEFMKMKILLFISLLLPLCVFAQQKNPPLKPHGPDSKAEFPKGDIALDKFLRDSLRYPVQASDSNFDALIQVKFIVQSDGKLSNPVIVSSFISSETYRKATPAEAKLFHDEVYRMLKTMPRWKPAIKNGVKVQSSCTIKVNFERPQGWIMGEKAPQDIESPAFRDDEPLLYADVPPKFPGGDTAMKGFIKRNIQYPPTAKENNIQGRVVVRFVVKMDGTIDNITVIKSIPSLDQEALRVIKMMPLWTPGKQNGQPVAVYMTLPFTFNLE
jgi:TonB family protein